MPVMISTTGMPDCPPEIQITSQAIQYVENCIGLIAIFKLFHEKMRARKEVRLIVNRWQKIFIAAMPSSFGSSVYLTGKSVHCQNVVHINEIPNAPLFKYNPSLCLCHCWEIKWSWKFNKLGEQEDAINNVWKGGYNMWNSGIETL